MRILYAVGSWGLGHATRSLPVIAALADGGDEVTVVSTERALQVLRDDLDGRVEFLDWPDVPQTVSATAWGFYLRTGAAIPWMLAALRRERERTADLIRRSRFDRIVSDNRLGVQHPDVPTFHVAHGLHLIAPARIKFLERRLEAFNARWLGHLRAVIVPDTREDRLSGDLGHRLEVFPSERVLYAGILSRLRRRDLPQDVELFVTLSGPEPQRSILEREVLAQLPSLGLRTVVALGAPGTRAHSRIGNTDVYGYLGRAGQEEMMNRAQVVIGRAGYSTLMDLAELRRRAVVIPTPGQTEQVYLARYHHARGTALAADQGRLHLAAAAARAGALSPLHASVTTAAAVRTITSVIRAG